ncbi:unnamed protein product [Closterium sp. NIES-64]|nr:unnamed protein product [Closterium sp. NIES-64]
MPPAAAIRFPLQVPRTLGAASPHAAFLPASDSPKSDRSLCRAREQRALRSAQNDGVTLGTLRVRPDDPRIPLACAAAGDEGGAARAEVVGAAGGAAEVSDARVARVMRVLWEDLPVQYERELGWSIYDASVAFVDPVTRLDGLILFSSLRIITAVGFEPVSLVFAVHSLE